MDIKVQGEGEATELELGEEMMYFDVQSNYKTASHIMH